MTRLYQITSTRFVAGITINEYGIVTHAAPIVAYMSGWTERRVMNYVRQKAWNVEPVAEVRPEGDKVTL